jgi:hypothetical protein
MFQSDWGHGVPFPEMPRTSQVGPSVHHPHSEASPGCSTWMGHAIRATAMNGV